MRLLLVCLAGAAGTGVRYLLGGWVSRTLGADFPYGTLVVNVVGSFLIGVIQPLAIPETARVTLAVGAMGGFTFDDNRPGCAVEMRRGMACLL